MKKSVLLLGLLVACGGDDGDGPTIITPDAPGGGNVDAPPVANCGVETSLSATFTEANSFAALEGDPGEQILSSGGLLNQDAMPDILDVGFYQGLPPFQDGFAAKVIPLTGNEANFATCGACVLVFANMTENTNVRQAETYFPTGGTLTVESVAGNLKWTISNATLQKVTIDWDGDFTSTPVNDGCTTTLNATLDTPIEQDPALRAGGNANLLRARKALSK